MVGHTRGFILSVKWMCHFWYSNEHDNRWAFAWETFQFQYQHTLEEIEITFYRILAERHCNWTTVFEFFETLERGIVKFTNKCAIVIVTYQTKVFVHRYLNVARTKSTTLTNLIYFRENFNPVFMRN